MKLDEFSSFLSEKIKSKEVWLKKIFLVLV
jgi:hypothetical protein